MASDTSDLRTTLLRHGIELARTGGADAVSIRDVQRRAGVSHAAAYRHYADREALLAAISDFAAAEMAAMMQSEIDTVVAQAVPSATALLRFRAVGVAYLKFAAAEPGLFAIAFRAGVSGMAPTEAVADPTCLVSPGPFHILSHAVDDLVVAGVLDADRRSFTEVAAWAGVHGLAILFEGPLRHLDNAGKDASAERLLDMFGTGVGVTAS